MKSSLFALALITVFLVGSNSHAQFLEQVQTDSDWGELFALGYFDYETYRIYSELSEGVFVADTLGYMESAPGNSAVELASPPSSDVRPADTSRIILPRLYARIGQQRYLGRNTGYYLARASGPKASIEYKVRKDYDRFETERRSFIYNGASFDLTLGNFTADIGSGLGIGRYDYRPLSTSDAGEQSFLYPDNSYYNGVLARYGDKLNFIYSSKKYNIETPMEYKKQFAAGALTMPAGEMVMGAAFGGTIFTRKEQRRALGVASMFFNYAPQGIRSEIAYAESGAGLFLGLDRNGYMIELWHYDPGYINPQSSGKAYPDYETYTPFDRTGSYRQRQAGETGMQIKRAFAAGNFRGNGVLEAWKGSPHDPVAADYSLAGRYGLGRGFSCRARYSQRWRDESLDLYSTYWERSLADFGLAFEGRIRIDLFSSLWVSEDSVDRARSLSQIYCLVPLHDRLTLAGRFRSHFDGDYDVFAEERFAASDHFSLKATYRWWNNRPDNQGLLYLVAEAIF